MKLLIMCKLLIVQTSNMAEKGKVYDFGEITKHPYGYSNPLSLQIIIFTFWNYCCFVNNSCFINKGHF